MVDPLHNPLNIEERLSVSNLIGHDVMQHLATLGGMEKFNPNSFWRRTHLLRYLIGTVPILQLNETCWLDAYKPRDISLDFEVLNSLLPENANPSQEIGLARELNTNKYILLSTLYNLARNACKANNGKVDVRLYARQWSGVVKDVTFRSAGSLEYGEFAVFGVHDNGQGFPQDKPMAHWLELGTTTRKDSGGTGFGLHFTKLVSKYLRSPLVITSQPGSTDVALYHPLNLP